MTAAPPPLQATTNHPPFFTPQGREVERAAILSGFLEGTERLECTLVRLNEVTARGLQRQDPF